MRTIASLLLTALCTASAWAADSFTDAHLQQMADAASGLAAGGSTAVTIVLNGQRISVGLAKNANGSITVAGDRVPASLRGTYTFTPGTGNLGVAFVPTGGGEQQTRLVTRQVTQDSILRPGEYLVEGAVAGTQAVVRGQVIYVGTVAYVLVEGTGELLRSVGNIQPGPIGDFLTNVGDGVSNVFYANLANTFQVGPYLTGQ